MQVRYLIVLSRVVIALAIIVFVVVAVQAALRGDLQKQLENGTPESWMRTLLEEMF